MRSGNMPQSLYQNWQFAIEVNGFDVALFHKGQEPKTEFEEVAFAPGGSMFDQKVAGCSYDCSSPFLEFVDRGHYIEGISILRKHTKCRLPHGMG